MAMGQSLFSPGQDEKPGPVPWLYRFLRDQPGWTYGIVTAIMALIFIWDPIPATGKAAGIIVFLALAYLGTYVLRHQTAEEFPDA